MGSQVWIGVTTKRRYEYMTKAIPAALISPITQQPLATATYNGETVVIANRDGSVARAVATGPPVGANINPQPKAAVNDIYDCYTLASLWEQAGAAVRPPGGNAGGGAGPLGGVPFGGGW